MKTASWQPVELPASSDLRSSLPGHDYLDSYRIELGRPISLDLAANVLGSPMTGVLKRLMAVREVTGRFVGLAPAQSYRAGDVSHPISFHPGDQLGFFTVYQRSGTELIAGENDNHFDYRVSILVEGAAAFLSTAVACRDRLGRIDFGIVKPFHRFLVPRFAAAGFARAISELTSAQPEAAPATP